MDASSFQDLYAYNFWANRRVWACVEALPEALFVANSDYAHGSLRGLCIHTLAVESWWTHFLASGELVFPDEQEFVTRESVRAAWQTIEKNVRGYIHTLTPQELQREVRPDFWGGGRKPIRVWQALLQVANHSTDHRAQMLAMLHHFGGVTTEQDYLTYLFELQADDSK